RQRSCALTGLAGAPSKVEVVVQLPRVGLEMSALQDELVRVEEAAEVGVGKRSRVRRITCALEAIEIESNERIDRCDLIVHEDSSARRGDARQLGDCPFGSGDVVERPARAREVECSRLERKLGGVALDE